MALSNESPKMSISLIDLFEHDTRLFEGVSSAITLNDFIFIRAKRDDLAYKLSELWAGKFKELGASVFRASQGANETGFEVFRTIADFSSFFLSSDFVDSLKSENDYVGSWEYIGLSNYHHRLYKAYSHLISEIHNTANQNHMTYLIFDGLTFDDHITKNILSNLIKDLLSNSQHSIKIIMVMGKENDSLESTVVEFKRYLDAKSVHFVDYPLPLPSLDNIRTALSNQFIAQDMTSTILNSVSKQISNAKINCFGETFFDIMTSQNIEFRVSSTKLNNNIRTSAHYFERLKPDLFFKFISNKLLQNDSLSVFELSRLIDFTYFYEYKHIVPSLKKLIDHESPIVKFSLLKPLQVFGTDTIDSNQHIVITIQSILPWLLKQSNAIFCEDVFFTIFRCYLFTEDKRILEFSDIYLAYLRDADHINYEKLYSFYRFHTSSSEETKNDLISFLDSERSSGYQFTVQRNSRFISLVSTAVEILFFDHELVSFTEELAYLEEKINSISSPISNELIAKANLAEEYTHAGKFENAKEIYLEIASVPFSMQIPNPEIFAQGSIYSLLISSGISVPAGDMNRIEDYGLQIKPCHTTALFYFNAFLLGREFSKTELNNLLFAFDKDYGVGVSPVHWMLSPLILWHADRGGLNLSDRKELCHNISNRFQVHEVERLLCDLIFISRAEEIHKLISQILDQGLQRYNFKPLRRSFAIAMLCFYANRGFVKHTDLYIAAARDYMSLAFISWRHYRESQAMISSDLTKFIFSYLGTIDVNDSETIFRLLDEYIKLEREITDPVSHGMFFTTALMSLFKAKSVRMRLFYKVNNSVRQSLEFVVVQGDEKLNLIYKMNQENGAKNVLTQQGFDYTVRGATARISDKQRTIEITIDSRNNTFSHDLQKLCFIITEKSLFLDVLKKSHEMFSAVYSCNEKLQHIDAQHKISFTRQIDFQEAHSKRLHTVLNSLNVGVCSIVSNKLLLGDETNSYFGERFIKSSSKRDFKTCVLDRSTLSDEQVELVLETLKCSIDEPSFILDLNMHHLPSEITCITADGPKTYEISWNFNTNSESVITEFIVVFTDVTDLRIRKKIEFLNSRRTEIYSIFSDLSGHDASIFLDSSKTIVNNIHKSLRTPFLENDKISLKRDLHTLKGISRTFLFNRLASLTHEAETALESAGDIYTTIFLKANQIDEYLHEIIVIYDKIFRKVSSGSDIESRSVKSLVEFIESKGLQNDEGYIIVRNHLNQETTYSFIFDQLSHALKSRNSTDLFSPTLDINCSNGIYLNDVSKKTLFKILPHLVVNSIVHGFGLKDPHPFVIADPTLFVRIESNGQLNVIEYWDNGRGLNIGKLEERADASDFSYKSRAELSSIVLLSGISTRDNVDIDSGRGVGLDAVRTEVESIGGHIEIVLLDSIRTGPYQPFKFKITVPSI